MEFRADEDKINIKYHSLSNKPIQISILKKDVSVEDVRKFKLVKLYNAKRLLDAKKKRHLEQMLEEEYIPEEHQRFYHELLSL